jgi:hypothetical protein
MYDIHLWKLIRWGGVKVEGQLRAPDKLCACPIGTNVTLGRNFEGSYVCKVYETEPLLGWSTKLPLRQQNPKF